MAKAVIFDMDGVISDTQKHHSIVESDILSKYGVTITPEEITRRYAGTRSKDMFKELLANEGKSIDCVETMYQEKTRMMQSIGAIEPIPGSIELITGLYQAGFPLAVGSASKTSFIDHVLSSLNIKQYFTAVVSGETLLRSKPDPEIFLVAARKIDTKPEDCVVIEDSYQGMTAAKRGNMMCIGLVSKIDYDLFPTKNQVLSLKDVSVDYIRNLD